MPLTNPNKMNSRTPSFKTNIGEEKKPKSMIESFSHNVGKDVGMVAGNASRKAVEYVDTTRKYVEHNPMKGIALAAAAGLAVGSIITIANRRMK